MGYDPLSVNADQFTTTSVISEVSSTTIAYTRITLALETGKLKIHTPSKCSLEEVEKITLKVGNFTALSIIDKEVLAIALELSRKGFHLKIVSDDYAIQNVANFLGLSYTSLTTFGIRYRFRWILYCPACKRKYASDGSKNVCDICGTRLKRRVLRKKAIKRS